MNSRHSTLTPMSDESFFKAQYPKLLSKQDVPEVSNHALAAKNLRIMLAQHYPGRKFSVKSSTYANGSSLRVTWSDLDLENDAAVELGKQVQAIVDRFAYGDFNGMYDSYTYATGERRAFIELFGAVKYAFAQAAPRSDLALAKYKEEMLEKSLPKRKPKSPGSRF